MSVNDERRGQAAGLAPVIPLFHGVADAEAEDAAADMTADAAAIRDAAEAILLRKLRARSLSMREATRVLSEAGLGRDECEVVVDHFADLGYLDDAKLAEQVVYTSTQRKGQGRQAVIQSMSQRGIPRELIDAALGELPDDDAERAREFADQKVRAMRGLERDVAVRRLSGQLMRRGYNSSLALSTARAALDGAALARPGTDRTRGVRFD